jgi:hypothetical protein
MFYLCSRFVDLRICQMLALEEQTDRRGDFVNSKRAPEAGWRARSGASSYRLPDSAPLQALAEGALSARFRSWRGASGNRYVFSVYDRRSCPVYGDAVLVVASALADGDRKILLIADTGCFPDMVVANAAAKFGDAPEFHVHLLANSPEARRALIADISQAGRS